MTGADRGEPSPTLHLDEWRREWGVGDPARTPGGLERPQPTPPSRQVTLLQRKPGKHGAGLGKTSGWVHRATLKMKNVEMLAGVNYERVTDEGLFVTFGPERKDGTLLEVDTIVLCSGQEPLRELVGAAGGRRRQGAPDRRRRRGVRAGRQARHQPGHAPGRDALKRSATSASPHIGLTGAARMADRHRFRHKGAWRKATRSIRCSGSR